MEIITTEKAASAIGPYSQAVKHGDMVFTSGQIALSPLTGEITASGIKEQTHQALENLKAVLEAAGSSIENVLKTTCFLADMSDFAAFNEVYAKHFGGHKPARSCIAVKTLPRNALVEVEAVAVVK